MFEDFGEATIHNGEAIIQFREEFTLCISTKTLPLITVTPMDNCNGLYIKNRTLNGFTVKECQNGTSEISFSWRAIAKRQGFKE
ncbi:MAG: hypothetical protein AB1349_13020 [Elusimicrobiota bacterium]